MKAAAAPQPNQSALLHACIRKEPRIATSTERDDGTVRRCHRTQPCGQRDPPPGHGPRPAGAPPRAPAATCIQLEPIPLSCGWLARWLASKPIVSRPRPAAAALAGLGMARRSAGSQLGKPRPRPRPRPVTQKNRPEPNVNVARYVTCPGGRLCLLPPAGPDSEPPVARVFGRWLALSGVGAGWCSRGRKRRSRPEARWRSTTSGLRLPRQRRFGGVPTPEANGVLNAPPVRAKWPVPSNSCP
jgi:hypothetical protein